jgi:putative transcriptional regulator
MKSYHYTECGLDNIYLVNGFRITKTENGDEEIFIHDIQGLHKTIGKLLVYKRGLLAGNEIKFIRTTLDLSQKALGRLLGLDYQSILGWEKNKTPISKTADHLLRIIFFSYLDRETDSTIYDKISEIADLDAEVAGISKIELKEVEDEWRLVA